MDAIRYLFVTLAGFALLVGTGARAQDAEREAAAVVEQARELVGAEEEREAKTLVAARIKEYQTALSSQPKNAMLWFGLARLQLELCETSAAADSIAAAKRLDPKNAQTWAFSGWILLMANKWPEAEIEYLKAIELDPKNSQIRTEYSACLMALKRFPDAEKQACEAVKLDARNADAAMAWSRVLFHLDREDEAIAAISRAVQFHPANQHLRDELATLLWASQRPAEAYAQREEIRKVTPDSIHNEAKMIVLASQMQDSQRAENHMARVRELQKAQNKTTESISREDFFVGKQRIEADEYFEPKGEVGYKFVFHVYDDRGQVSYQVFLATIAEVNKRLRKEGKIKPEQCVFVMGKLHQGRTEQFGVTTKQPTYEQTRALAIEIIEGKLQPKRTPEAAEAKANPSASSDQPPMRR